MVESESATLLLEASGAKINGVVGGNKKQKWKQERDEEEEAQQLVKDANIIGLEVLEESSDSQEEEEDTAEPETKEENVVVAESKEIQSGPPVVNPPVNDQQKPDLATKMPSKPAVFIPVHRTAEVQAARMKLPILAEEQAIVEAIHDNPVVILAGETGSGKTTQVHFAYKNEFKLN